AGRSAGEAALSSIEANGVVPAPCPSASGRLRALERWCGREDSMTFGSRATFGKEDLIPTRIPTQDAGGGRSDALDHFHSPYSCCKPWASGVLLKYQYISIGYEEFAGAGPRRAAAPSARIAGV